MRVQFEVPGEPIGKPRMTQRDVWKQRPCVMEYRSWCDRARRHAGADFRFGKQSETPPAVTLTAYFEIPRSWNAKKRAAAAGAPHQAKPDSDNVGKALLDALFSQDQKVSDLVVRKRWDDGHGPRLHVVLDY
jgi:Holliday junction resolvase RusA-like endonuclease